MKCYSNNLIFCCNESNDLYNVLKNCGYSFERSSDLMSLVKKAEDSAGILILADDYPIQTVVINQDVLNLA
ncbi:MAG TPA: hypothetical protein GXX37_05920, partial [Clostridiaceae bacterium]|nr:hypothetical protein [Clostridiaceae bacterium]